MTVIGKMLTFLVLLLSLAWFYLTANAYVARTNWRAEAKRASADAVAMQQAGQKLKDAIDQTRDASEDAVRALRAERDRLQQQVAALQQNQTELSAQYTAAFSDAQRRSADAVRLQANIDRLQLEVRNADEKAAKNLADLNALTLEANRNRDLRAAAELALSNARRQLETKNDQVARLQQDLDDVRNGRNGGRAVPAPSDLRASVTRFDRDRSYVVVNQGLDADLREGARLSLSRVDPQGGGQYLGEMTVILSNPKEAVGVFRPANKPGGRTTADDPRPGDLAVAPRR